VRFRPSVLVVAVLVALAVTATALADRYGLAFTHADQVRARSAVLKLADLGAGWSGGPKKPNLSNDTNCPGFSPKLSDLVMTGAAESEFRAQTLGMDVDSEVGVMRTAAMVQTDWQRTVKPAALLPCLRSVFKKSSNKQTKLVSLTRRSFPPVAPLASELRLIASVSAGGTSIQIISDIITLGRGRMEITLSVTGPALAKAALERTELQLARTLASRMHE
jgi:hypothetical protein